MPRLLLSPLLVLIALAGCTRSHEVVAPPDENRPSDAWRTIATADDLARVRHWRKSWTDAIVAATPGNEAAIAREGVLLDPDSGLAGARPPAGDYRCRTIKLGAQAPGQASFRVFGPQPCRIEAAGTRLHFIIPGGPQRPLGTLFPDSGHRMIFLGTLELGDEALAYRYGRDRERDMVGLLERIGDGRWRLVFPAPHFESLLDVVELVPAR